MKSPRCRFTRVFVLVLVLTLGSFSMGCNEDEADSEVAVEDSGSESDATESDASEPDTSDLDAEKPDADVEVPDADDADAAEPDAADVDADPVEEGLTWETIQSEFAVGVNIAGFEFTGSELPGTANTHYPVINPTILDYWIDNGVRQFRLPFKWERVQHELEGELDEAYLGYIMAVVDYAGEQGARVILDMHNYGRRHGSTIGSDEVPISAYRDVWSKLAQEFEGHPGVLGYDIMNEPHGLPGGSEQWVEMAQEAILGIREHDTSTWLFIEGYSYSNGHRWQGQNPTIHTLSDSSDRIIWSPHQYFDENNTGTYAHSYDDENAYEERGADRINNFIEWMEEHGFSRGHVGEYGVPDDDERWLELMDTFLAHLGEHGMLSSAWADGPWWANYALKVGADRPQSAVIIEHANN